MPSNAKLLAGAAGGGDLADPNFKNVTLLLHGDGSNGAQNNTFIDSSTNNFTITRNGNTTQGSFSPYGSNWSNYFDGSGDYLSLPSNTALPTANQSYTIEAWVCPSALTGTHAIIGWGNYGTNNQVNALTISPTSITNYWWARDLSASYTFAVGSWYHIVAQFDGTTRSIYVNGTRVATDTPTGHNVPSPVTNATVGTANNLSEYFNGYISNVRVVTGQAIYSGSTITPPTAPLTAITNTSLLTCAYNRFRDGSTNNFTITRNGDVKVTNFAPFAPSSAYSTSANGGSGYFDGTGDWLSVSNNSAFNLSNGDFTLECWAYNTEVANTVGYMGVWDSGYLLYREGSTYKFYYYGPGFSNISASIAAIAGAWTHLAVVRNGSTMTFYVNGVSAGTASIGTTSIGFPSQPFVIGANGNNGSPSNSLSGYISNLRVVKGTAVYTAAFTPPTSPVTAITNTSILTNFTNAAIFDNSMKNDLETVGNAQISTSVKKFGTGSMAFDGSGDVLQIPYSVVNSLGSDSAWTVELWFYSTTSTGANRTLFRTQDGGFAGVAIVQNGTNLYVDLSTSGSAWNWSTGAKSFSLNTWNHLAVVRNGSTTTAYLNGTSYYSASSVSIWDSGSPIYIGGRGISADYFEGYVDDLRVTKGIARYTANFTPPTAAFPNK
jgi:Concanavalin A-like lectin/glucanases superfamily